MVSGVPSPSPSHRDAPGTPDTTKSEARRRGPDPSAAPTLNRHLRSDGAVARKRNRRIGNRVDDAPTPPNGAPTPRKSNRSLRLLRRRSSALNKTYEDAAAVARAKAKAAKAKAAKAKAKAKAQPTSTGDDEEDSDASAPTPSLRKR
ncbi:hypothetical protein QYE76_007110 [Lolium multiflorum]|uniref:Uncharacterized protein n=1 Tax=Lolium multiflorum TaxID=4521 RepID=A0AAD8RVY1_LOLMU|nr:hypothetical protein QYE76_007110 [Lolium multiflorum]